VLKRIFGPNRDEIIGWRKLYNEEPHKLYSSQRHRVRLEGYVAGIGDKRNAYGVSVGKPEGKRALRRPRNRWENNIKNDIRERGGGGMDWIHLAQDRNIGTSGELL
jgi:hypothetical protein